MVKYARYCGNEMTVSFQAQTERSDYGVPGSLVWDEIVDIEVRSIEMLGIDVDFDKLPKDLQDAILELADECEWGND